MQGVAVRLRMRMMGMIRKIITVFNGPSIMHIRISLSRCCSLVWAAEKQPHASLQICRR